MLQHYDPSFPIEISWDSNTVTILNRISADYPLPSNQTAGPQSSGGGTDLVLLGYVRHYAPGRESDLKSEPADDPAYWETKLPLPPSFI